jgi:hypothetical protein
VSINASDLVQRQTAAWTSTRDAGTREGGPAALHDKQAVSSGRADAVGADVLTRVALRFWRGGDASGREESPVDKASGEVRRSVPLERKRKSAFAFAVARGREVRPRGRQTKSMMNESEEGEHEDEMHERDAHGARDAFERELVRGAASDEDADHLTGASWGARAIPRTP